ncbi:MAG: hypothetical protein JW797_01345 [Bradymonadales bacterium]|nr:hypothetical protein [Bradymonadales bacterium]
MTRKVLCLVDGEHHPPVTRWALETIERQGDSVVSLVFLGGFEKVENPLEQLSGGSASFRLYPGGSTRPPLEAIARAIDETAPDLAIDLSDEPIVSYRDRFRIASLLLSRGVAYQGADFSFAPLHLEPVFHKPSLAIVGTGKRVGKTGVSVFISRLLKAHGFDPLVVSMGRGGPPEPDLVDPTRAPLTPETLIEVARRGGHAASDYWEDAYLAQVPTIGCRRCGGGMAGEPFISNVVEGARLAEKLPHPFIILEGSGQTYPPVKTDASLLIIGAGQPIENVLQYLGEYRILQADLAVVTMCEPPFADVAKLDELTRGLALIKPGLEVVLTVFRPDPLGDLSGKRVFLATTSAPQALPSMKEHLERHHGCTIVGATASLANRAILRKELAAGLPSADVLLTEIKAASIDVAAMTAVEHGVEVQFMNNIPLPIEGDLSQIETKVLALCQGLRDRWENTP